MNTEKVTAPAGMLEAIVQQTEGSVEYWIADDLQHLLGYTERCDFTTFILKAKTSGEVSGYLFHGHCVDVNKMVNFGSGSQRKMDDIPGCARDLERWI